jgi:hypothetical protein
MKLRYSLALLVTVMLTLAGAAQAQVASESAPKFGGHVYLDLASGTSSFAAAPASAQIAGDVYNNTTSTANFGYSSTDLNAIMGDRLTTAGAGVLDQFDFTIYNSSSSAGPLLTATYLLNFYDGPTSTSLGGFTTNVTFGTGLAVGYYTIVSVTGLSSLSIAAPTDLIVTQKRTVSTGTATRLGIVSLDPPTIGSSPATFYLSTTTTPAGFYTITGSNANPGYRVNVLAAVPAHATTWGMLKSLYR